MPCNKIDLTPLQHQSFRFSKHITSVVTPGITSQKLCRSFLFGVGAAKAIVISKDLLQE
jgi:hypothetical protein